MDTTASTPATAYAIVLELPGISAYHGGSSDVPVWSIDSQPAFYTATVGDNIELFRMTLDGQSEQLTKTAEGTSHYHPKSSPDGKSIA